MNQSGIMTGAVLGGFLLFLAARNRLATYAHILWGAAPQASTTANSSVAGTSTGLAASSTPGGLPGASSGAFNPSSGSTIFGNPALDGIASAAGSLGDLAGGLGDVAGTLGDLVGAM